jgi:hypothetical protein
MVGAPPDHSGADGVAVLRCRTMETINDAKDRLRYLGPSHAGMSKPSAIEHEVELGDIWATWDEYHGYAD